MERDLYTARKRETLDRHSYNRKYKIIRLALTDITAHVTHVTALNNVPFDWRRRDIAVRSMLFPVDSGGGTPCPVFPDRGCYPENNNKASRKYSTILSQPHNLRSEMFSGGALRHKICKLL